MTKIFIITSSAGGGLLQAAVAQEQQVKSDDVNAEVIKHDVLRDVVWGWLGTFCIESWNRAQKKGNVKWQKFYASLHWLFDYIAWPSVFFHTLKILFQENVDRVIDTQTTSTSAIVKAIRIFNWKRSKNVVLEKIIVDLPTKKATHFFRPIKALSRTDKKVLKLRTIYPLLDDEQTADDFWQFHCGIPESGIHYEDVNIRQSFRAFQGKARKRKTMHLKLKVKNSEELLFMRETWERGTIAATVHRDHVSFDIPGNAFVFTVLLGSQPARAATLNYVEKFIELAKAYNESGAPIYLFVFCADHHLENNSLFKEAAGLVQSVENYPKRLSIIPFSFQNDDAIAPLFHRSDATCSRSGGQTAMELMGVSTGEIWIHSETKKKDKPLTLKQLLKGIPVWESESAYYLVKLKGAKLVTPETFMPEAERLISSKNPH